MTFEYQGEIMPTGTCFDDPVWLLDNDYFEQKDMQQIRIVHALVSRVRVPEKVYAHCWCELHGKYIECGRIVPCNEKIVMEYSRKEFMKLYRIHDQTKYSLQEIALKAMSLGIDNTGPFEQRYLEKCNDYHALELLEA